MNSSVPPDLTHIKGLKDISRARVAAVYFLVKDEKVIYVGQSSNVCVRICDHRCNKQFDRAFYVEVAPCDLLRMEAKYTKKFLGKLINVRHCDRPNGKREAALDIWGEPFLVPLSEVDEVLTSRMKRFGPGA